MSEVKLGSQIWVKEEKTHQKVLTKQKKKKWEQMNFKFYTSRHLQIITALKQNV